MKSVNEQCVDLAAELMRLADCAVKHAYIIDEDKQMYVDAVERHFLALLVNVADIKKAHELELQDSLKEAA